MTDLAPTFARLAHRIALRRLRRDRAYFWVSSLSMALGLALAALAAAWAILTEWRPLPWPEPESLWQVQVTSPSMSAWQGIFKGASTGDPVASQELVRSQQVFDSLGVALRDRLILRESDRPLPTLKMDRAMIELLGIRPALGRLPAVASGEMLVTWRWAIGWFGAPELAIDQVLATPNGGLRIVGVLPPEFFAPLPIAEQRNPDRIPVAIIPVETHQLFDGERNNQVLIGRSSLPKASLQRALHSLRRKLQSDLGLGAIGIEIASLPEWIRDSERRTSRTLFAIALLLWVTSTLGVAAATVLRMRLRTSEQFVQLVVGLDDRARSLNALHEVGLLAGATTAFSAVAISILIALLARHPTVSGLVTPSFLVVASAGIVFGGAVLWLALRTAVASTLKRAESVLIQDQANRRGADRAAKRSWSQRLLISTQVLVAWLATLVTAVLAGDSPRVLASIFDSHYDRLAQIELRRVGPTPAATLRTAVDALQTRFAQDPAIRRTALANTSALDLIGHPQGYSGSRDTTSWRPIPGKPDFYEIPDRQNRQKSASAIRYLIAHVWAEPAWLTMLGFPIQLGRPFADQEENAVLLSPEARDVLFGPEPALGQRVPALPRRDDTESWHNGLQVVGIVEPRRVLDVGLVMLSDLPIAISPFPTSRFDRLGIEAVTLLIERNEPFEDESWLASATKQLPDGLSVTTMSLGAELRRRLAKHLLALGLLAAVAAMVTVSAALNAQTAMTQLAWASRGEIAIRRAIGEREWSIATRLIKRELAWPLAALGALCFAIWMLLPLIEPLAPAIGATQLLTSAAIVVAALLVGTASAIGQALARPPMQVLSSEY